MTVELQCRGVISSNYLCTELKILLFSALLTVVVFMELSENRDRSGCGDRDGGTSEGGDATVVPQVPLGVSAGSVVASLVWPPEVPLQVTDSKHRVKQLCCIGTGLEHGSLYPEEKRMLQVGIAEKR